MTSPFKPGEVILTLVDKVCIAHGGHYKVSAIKTEFELEYHQVLSIENNRK